jgi:hypothetical protein
MEMAVVGLMQINQMLAAAQMVPTTQEKRMRSEF